MRNLAHNTVVSIVRAACVKGQMVHNHRVSKIETQKIASDEFWSFVEKRCDPAEVSSARERVPRQNKNTVK